MLEHIPRLISDLEIEQIEAMPTREEVQQAMFGLSGDSDAGLDGFGGAFFQNCWDIVADDMVMVVKAFFCG